MSYIKPQTPLQHKDGDYFYPLTTIDQVIMEDGITRLNGADLVSVNTDGAPEGETVKVNADTLGGISADKYATVDDLNGKLSTDKIVNNFTTTEEGFVADARALKVLNDSKLSMELLWENASPSSTFAEQTINLDLSRYTYVRIFFGGMYVDIKVGKNGRYSSFWKPNNVVFAIRTIQTTSDSITFSECFTFWNNNISTVNTDMQDVFIPVEIYGIKGVN